MHPALNTAIKAARRAGTLILRYLEQLDRIVVEEKGRNDFVSEVDRRAESEIIEIIRHAYPDHSILAEESGSQGSGEFQWVIDPLDGTTNFLHGYPQFSVSIALQKAGTTEQAVVFDPLRNELFTASRGRGAQLNDRRIRVSQTRRLANCLIGTGFPFREVSRLDAWLKSFRAILTRTQGVRRAGSAALDLAHVACGRFDGFWEQGLSKWDMAAGCLLIEEAGGLVCDFSGAQGHLDQGDIVAANPDIHGELLAIISKNMDG